ncbi:MAG: abortive infection family protein [Gemmatimonadota bacterium]
MVDSLQNLLVARATGASESEDDYYRLRQAVLDDSEIEPLLPRFVRTCRNLGQFWQFIKNEYGSYAERRQYLWNEFWPLLERLERGGAAPSDSHVSGAIEKIDSEHIQAAWSKALERRASDPEGAITAARTLLESVCKHVLDASLLEYDDAADLPKLYRLTADSLKLAPSQNTEQVFRQILGGCTAVVEGLGTLRNRLSDAHGKGKVAARPAARHAELAVNLAGALAMYLLATFDARGEGGT